MTVCYYFLIKRKLSPGLSPGTLSKFTFGMSPNGIEKKVEEEVVCSLRGVSLEVQAGSKGLRCLLGGLSEG